MRGLILWVIRALLVLILISLLIPLWSVFSAFNSLPHARTLAKAYATSPSCASSLLSGTTAQSSQALSAAASGSLCEIQSMTLQEKHHSHFRHADTYSLILVNNAGTKFDVLLSTRQLWYAVQPPVKVNAQLVEGRVAMIAKGAVLARTSDHPQVALASLRTQILISSVLSIPFVALLGLFVTAWVKKSRQRASGGFEQLDLEARARVNSPDAAWAAVSCPDFQRQPLAQAREELKAAGYRIGRISFITSTSVPAGTIVEQTPPPGSQVARGTAFNFQVSIEG
jgi:PASTA domain